ncbi:hypothetical protein [Phytoactinopolyspora mesophila]|uniref:Uncharacterized protein n=1 Tax=Phytoactinopolyspora mesophila TaxID=2650750 RepID=A0A7K3M3G4_9ACTN|nr:hypothetical protein [Phytoactinopolyspora mesophila]NDL56988.1 hypothetical protein [Phytoactinopolyspora mesophila]
MITVDELGDATTTITSPTGQVSVDRADAWKHLAQMASDAGHPLLVRTVDEHGRAYRDVVHAVPAPRPEYAAVDDGAPSPEEDGSPPAESRHSQREQREDANRDVDLPAVQRPRRMLPPPRATENQNAGSKEADESQHEPVVDELPATGDVPDPVAVSCPADEGSVHQGARAESSDGRTEAAVMACASAVLLACTLAMVIVSKLDSPGGKYPATAVAVASVPGRIPPGFSDEPVWQVDLAPGTAPVTGDSELVAVHARDGHVRLVEAATGTVVWEREAGTDAGSLFLVRIDGNDTVVWQRARELVVGTPANGDAPVVHRTGPRARVSNAGDAVLVSDPDMPGRVWALNAPGLVEVGIGEDETAMAVVDGVVVSSNGSAVLQRTPVHGGQSEVVALDRPEGMVIRRWAGMAGNAVTVVWDRPGQDEDRDVVLMTHDASSGQEIASARAKWADVRHARLTASQGTSPVSVALGPVTLWLDGAREAAVEPETTWLWHTERHVWGVRDDGHIMRIDPAGDVEVLPADTPAPLGVTSDGVAVTVVGGTAYALAPENGTTTETTRNGDRQ